jgi:hypothetical protein
MSLIELHDTAKPVLQWSCISRKETILQCAVKPPRYRKMKDTKEVGNIRKHYGKFKWNLTIGRDKMILDYRLRVYSFKFCQRLR